MQNWLSRKPVMITFRFVFSGAQEDGQGHAAGKGQGQRPEGQVETETGAGAEVGQCVPVLFTAI